MNFEEEINIKLILLGESAVGKTSIINRYVEDSFSNDIISSSSMTYSRKRLIINKQNIILNIWDTVGQEKFKSLSKLFFNDTKIVVLVYSITEKDTFIKLDYWLKTFQETIGDDVVLGVAGNKSDLFFQQTVSEEEGAKYAEKIGAIFSEISAKENKKGLDKFIEQLVTEYIKRNPNLITNKESIRLFEGDDERQIKAGCCTSNKNKRVIKKYGNIVKEKKGVINVIFLGENSAGKTSIINRINNDEFNFEEKHTEKLNKTYTKYNNGKMKLQIIINDVDNDKKKSSEFIELIKKSDIFFLVYDVKDDKSAGNIYYWIEVISQMKDDINKDLIYILANKNDKEDENKNFKLIEKGRQIAEINNAKFKAISAKDNEGIDKIIEESVDEYLAKS
jgi:small GTP-binding protein